MTPAATSRGNQITGVVTVLLTLAGWTVTPLFIRYFADPQHHVDAWTSNGWRYGFAALLWLPVILITVFRKKMPKGIWKAAMIPAAFNSAAQVPFTLAHYHIDPGLIAFGLRSQIVCVAIAAAILFPLERKVIRSRGFIAGLLMVMLGTAGTIAAGEGFGQRASTLGVMYAVLAGCGFAFYAVAVRACMHGISSLLAFAVISLYTAGVQVALMLVLGDRHGAGALDLPPPIFGIFLLSALIGIALGHVLYYMSIARLGVALSTGVIQLQPFTVALLSLWWFNELLSPAQWVLGVVAVFGAIVMLYAQHRIMSRLKRESSSECDELPADHVAAAFEAECETE